MSQQPSLNLRPGELVRVRDAAEILASLDDNASLDGLPFMPEMLQFSGRTFRVHKRADKTCDTIELSGLRRMTGTVHLDDLRCDGSGHGGCQAGCLLFWKEAWLTRAGDAGTSSDPDGAPASAAALAPERVELVTGAARRAGDSPEDERFSCQATQLLAATAPLNWWDARQYVRDLRTGNTGPFKLGRGLAVFLFNKYQGFSKRFLPARLRIREGRWYPFTYGTLDKTPTGVLGLQPGELVRVKSTEEILATLDRNGRNRGLTFDGEMLKYCGRQARVLRRVTHIIEERTGRMLTLPRDCIILEDVTCQADYHRFCPRGIYPYWREIWLERVHDPRVDDLARRQAGAEPPATV
jgi:hypothetical protein